MAERPGERSQSDKGNKSPLAGVASTVRGTCVVYWKRNSGCLLTRRLAKVGDSVGRRGNAISEEEPGTAPRFTVRPSFVCLSYKTELCRIESTDARSSNEN